MAAFLRIAEWLARLEIAPHAKLVKLDAEIGGGIEIPFGRENVKLTVRADRMEHLKGGRYAVLDYRTGAPPKDGCAPDFTAAHARSSDPAPQRLREHSCRRQRGGADVCALRGGANAAKRSRSSSRKAEPIDAHAEVALPRLAEVLAGFIDANNPFYRCCIRCGPRLGTYDRLARVQEWSLTGATNEEPIFE